MSIKIYKLNFPIILLYFNEKKSLILIEILKIDEKTEFVDLFAHLANVEVLKYLPSFPYWAPAASESEMDRQSSNVLCTYLMVPFRLFFRNFFLLNFFEFTSFNIFLDIKY